jgi:hypothetical protein
VQRALLWIRPCEGTPIESPIFVFYWKYAPFFSHSEWWHVYDAFSVLFLNI